MNAIARVVTLSIGIFSILISPITFASRFEDALKEHLMSQLSEPSLDQARPHKSGVLLAYNRDGYSGDFSESTFIFSPRQKRWFAYNSVGYLVASGRASGGRHYCPDVGRSCRTPSGSYRVQQKGGPGCESSKYPLGEGGAPMPFCMFFKGGYAIHGSPDVPNYNASHGCIRVEPRWARWLNHEFIDIGTKVIVHPY